jgi:hypothetical protein
MASPSAIPVGDRAVTTTANDMTAAIIFAAQADCDLFQCAAVVASAACIAAGIAAGQPEAVLACVASGTAGVSQSFIL